MCIRPTLQCGCTLLDEKRSRYLRPFWQLCFKCQGSTIRWRIAANCSEWIRKILRMLAWPSRHELKLICFFQRTDGHYVIKPGLNIILFLKSFYFYVQPTTHTKVNFWKPFWKCKSIRSKKAKPFANFYWHFANVCWNQRTFAQCRRTALKLMYFSVFKIFICYSLRIFAECIDRPLVCNKTDNANIVKKFYHAVMYEYLTSTCAVREIFCTPL